MRCFYIVSNYCQDQLGFFILRIKEDEPYNGSFLIKWQNKLQFGDANIDFLKCPHRKYREMVVSYKVIYLNIFNLLVMDIGKMDKGSKHDWDKQYIIYRHESFQLWESDIDGILLTPNFNYVILNKDGLSVYSLGNIQKQMIIDDKGQQNVVHSLESCNYLKLEKYNNLVYLCSSKTGKEIAIEEEYNDKLMKSTKFQSIYKVKIWTVTLRELLLI